MHNRNEYNQTPNSAMPIETIESIKPSGPIEHYENFPVGSWLVPASKRPLVHAIYRFARFADDIADEGLQSAEQRVAGLKQLQAALQNPFALDPCISDDARRIIHGLMEHGLCESNSPYKPYLLALLDAFIQDSTNSAPTNQPANRMFEDHQSLLRYCERSANPIGRMMLLLFDAHKPELLNYSDAICTGLQWVNFMQDVSVDAIKGRIYAPSQSIPDAATVMSQTNLARQMLISGKPLLWRVPFRLSLELRAILAGGVSLADKIIALKGNTQVLRPALSKKDGMQLLWRFIYLR
jgi:hydroxysqualene synthase